MNGTDADETQALGSWNFSSATHDRLVQAIVDHRLPPGTKLGEERLASIFGISRSKVREVLHRLAQLHLVTLLPHRGAFVTEPSTKEAREIFDTRRVIEVDVVKRVAAMSNQVGLFERLEEVVAREKAAWDRGDNRTASHASQEFHTTLAQTAGNSVLAETLQNVISRASLSLARYGRPGNPGCLCHEHFAILDAVRNGEPIQAADLMIDHLRHIEQRLNLVADEGEADLELLLRDTN